MRNFYKNLKTLILLAFLFLGFVNVWAAGLPYNTTMTKNHYNNSSIKVGSDGLTYSQNKWDGGVFLQAGTRKNLLGSIKGEEWNWDDKYVIIAIETNSVPYQLEFKYATNSIIASNAVWYVSESSDNKNWTQKWTVESNSITKSSLVKVDLSKSTKYIKLCYSGNYGGIYSDIKVTDQAYVHNPKVNDEEISSLDFGTGTISSGKAELTFDVEWCNVNTLSVTSSNATYFTVSPASFGQTTKYGTQTVTVYYDRDKAVGNHSGTITINNGTAKYTKAVTVSGSTTKRPQEIHWNEDLVASNYTLNAEESLTGSEVATADNEDGEITYFSNNTSVIAVSPDGKTLSAVSNGTAVITVTSTGSELYDEGEDSKTFTVTSKKKQIITWTDQLLGLKTNAKPNYIDLTATATSNGPITYAIEGGSASCITLSGTNNSRLTITGTPGEAYIIATQAGGDEWIEATTRKKVTVRDPNAACDEYALADESFTFNSGIKDGMVEQQFALTGTPTQLTFTAKRGNLRYAWSEQQDLFIEQYANFGSGLEWRQVTSIKPETSNKNYGPFAIDGTATKIRFYSGEYAQQQVTNISIPRKKELSVSTNSITEDAERNVKWSKTISVTRSNIDIVDLSVVSTDTDCPFVLNKTSLGTDCADMSTESFEVSFTPHQKGKTYTGTITITDGKANPTTQTISLSVTSVAFNQAITWNFEDNQEFYTTHETLTLDATTDATGLEVSYRLADGEDAIATLNGNSLFFIGSGTIHVTAYQEGNDKYNAAENVTKTIVIKPDTPHIATTPSGTAVTYLQKLSTSTLSGGSADITLRGVANTAVAGSFAWTSPNYQVVEAAGGHSYGVTFTPTDGGMYTTTTGSVEITVNKAAQNIVMKDSTLKVAVSGLDANAADSKLDLDELIVSQTSDPVNNNRVGAVTYEVISANSANATIATGNIFSTTAIGPYTIRATKAATNYYNAATAEFTVTVGKRANTLAVVGPQTLFVDDFVSTVALTVNSNATIETSSEDEDLAYYDPEQNKIYVPNSANESFDEKDVTIRIWQAANNQFEASGEKTVTVKVKKYDNWFKYSWNGGSNKTTGWHETMNFDEEFAFVYSTQNTITTPTINQTDGDEEGNVIATYSGNKIKAYGNIGNAVWALHQDENYKYKKADATMTVKVDTKDCPTCYAFKYDPDNTVSQINEVGWGVDSVAGTLTLSMKPTGTLLGDDAFLSYWVKDQWVGPDDIKAPISGLTVSSCSYQPIDAKTLNAHTTRLKFEMGGELISTSAGDVHTDDPKVNNIRVSRLAWLELNNTQTGKAIDTLFINKELGEQNKKGTFQVKISTCDTDAKLTSNDSKVTLSETSIALTKGDTYDGGYLSKNITVTYVCDHKDTTDAIISVYTKYEHKTFVVRAITKANTQEINWKSGYEGNIVSLPVNASVSITDAATASSGLTPVLYSTNNSAVIEIAADQQSFKIISTGTATLTASQAGNDEYEPVESSKTIQGSEKIIQSIVWERNFTRSMTVGQTIKMEASVDTLNTTTGAYEHSDERTAKLKYSCSNDGVIEIIDSCYMHILAEGTTTVTAYVEGDSRYEEANYIKQVVVRPASVGCESHSVYVQGEDEEMLFYLYDFNMPEITKTITFSPDSGMPDKLNFSLRGVSYHRVGSDFFDKNIDVYESSNGATWTFLQTVKAYADTTVVSGDIQLSPQTTMLKFVRPHGGQGYHYIEDLTVSRLAVLDAEEIIDLGEVPAGSVRIDNIPFTYSELKTTELTVTKGEGDETYNKLELDEDAIDIECGGFGEYNLGFAFKPTKVESLWSQTVTVKDTVANKSFTVTIHAKVTQGTQSIEWATPTQSTLYTVEEAELNAQLPKKSNRNLDLTLSSSATDIVSFSGQTASIHKYGDVTIYANCDATSDYKEADQVSHDFTILITPTEIVTAPTLPTIYGGTNAGSVVLNTTNAVAQETIKHGNVSGGYAIYSPAVLNAGIYEDVIIKFTPQDQNKFAPSYITIHNVTVEQRHPNAQEAAVTVGNIIYGQQINEASLTNNGTVYGTWSWKDEAANEVRPNVGTYPDLNVHFEPNNGNYEAIDTTVSVTVLPATPELSWVNAPVEVAYNATGIIYSATSTSNEGAISYSIISGASFATINSTTGELSNLTGSKTIVIQASQAASDNYNAPEAITVTVNIGKAPYIFTGGDGDWNNENNWEDGNKPTDSDPDIIVTGELIIDDDVTVGDLTIETTGGVTIVEDGTLTVTGSSEERNEGYGDLYVKNGGEVDITGSLTVGDLTVEASIGTSDGTAESGQVEQANNVTYANAYIEINMDPSGTMNDSKWYGFTVPFAVDVHNGVSRKINGVYSDCGYGVHYMIAEYDADKRLNTGNGWKYVTTQYLEPGRFYFFTVGDNLSNTYRFKSADASYSAPSAATLQMNGDINNSHANWNGLGNSQLQHVKAQFTNYDGSPTYVQIYKNGLDAYEAVPTSEATFVVGCPFFIQATQESSVVLNVNNSTSGAHYAPRHTDATQSETVRLSLKSVDGGYTDKIYVSTADKEQDCYKAGHDLSKAGISKVVPQLWVSAYGEKLSVHEAALFGNNAICPLGMYVPASGEYILSATQPNDNTQIYLTMEGQPIWNITLSEYVLSLEKGNENAYGLMIVKAPQVATGVDAVDANTERAEKIILNNQLYILRNSEMYDATGKKVQ